MSTQSIKFKILDPGKIEPAKHILSRQVVPLRTWMMVITFQILGLDTCISKTNVIQLELWDKKWKISSRCVLVKIASFFHSCVLNNWSLHLFPFCISSPKCMYVCMYSFCLTSYLFFHHCHTSSEIFFSSFSDHKQVRHPAWPSGKLFRRAIRFWFWLCFFHIKFLGGLKQVKSRYAERSKQEILKNFKTNTRQKSVWLNAHSGYASYSIVTFSVTRVLYNFGMININWNEAIRNELEYDDSKAKPIHSEFCPKAIYHKSNQ